MMPPPKPRTSPTCSSFDSGYGMMAFGSFFFVSYCESMLGGKEALLKAFVDSGLIFASEAVWMAKEGGKEKMLSGNPGRNKYGWGYGQ